MEFLAYVEYTRELMKWKWIYNYESENITENESVLQIL